MSSLRTFSSAVSGSADDAATAGSWTHVSRGNNRSAGSWGTPTLPVAPATGGSGTRAFSFASAATAAALDDSTPMPPRAPSSRTLQTGPPPPKQANVWSAARPAGAVAAAAAPKTVDIRSLSDFPSLGGPSTPAAARPQRSNAMSWSTTVAEAVARDAPPSLPAAAAPTAASDDITADLASLRSRYRQPAPAAEAPAARRSRLANIGTRCFDDGPTDYTGPEEFDDDDGAGSYREEGYRRTDTPTMIPDSNERHADLGYRAGYKSDW